MFLRSLTLKGFKSFAEPTTIELEPGVSAVVGPNGSGKSNVVDAVAWVLGAQGPRTVRSGRMDDVIFAGNSRRQALGRAEVSLTIDNSSGLLPVEFSEVTLTRTLFRSSGESEYAINGAPCRLLDVQELLSDTGVGRQQHVIVSQGQLDAVLDARPEDRRLIVEEAAGVLKYRRRKEKAERRLAATEANLVRLTDLNREIGRQLRPLERQAEAARRHGSLAGDIRRLRLHLAGREILALTARRDAAVAQGDQLHVAEACTQAELAALDDDVAAAEAALAALGESRLGCTAARLDALRERARGLGAVLTERSRSVARDRAGQLATSDAALVAQLDAEADRLAASRVQVDELYRQLTGRLREVTEEERVLAALVPVVAAPGELFASEGLGTSPPGSASEPDPAQVRGELAARKAALARTTSDRGQLDHRIEILDGRAVRLAQAAAEAAGRRDEALVDQAHLQQEMGEAEGEVGRAEARVASARAEVAEAAARHQAAVARVDALALALDQAQPESQGLIADGPGVLGTLAGLITVDAGWEAAVAAVLADAESTLIVDGESSARELLSAGAAGGSAAATPTVVPLDIGTAAGPPIGTAAGPPVWSGRGRPLRGYVQPARPELAGPVGALLDRLLAGVVAVDGAWDEALDVSVSSPTAVVVTRAGDRFSSTGWRVGGRGWHAARVALDAATEQVAVAAAGRDECQAALDSATAAFRRLQARSDGLSARWSDVANRLASAGSTCARLDREQQTVAAELAGVRDNRDQLVARAEPEHARVAHLEALLPRLEADQAEKERRREAEELARRRQDERIAEARARRMALEREVATAAERRRSLAVQCHGIEERRAAAATVATGAAERLAALDVLAGRVDRLGRLLEERLSGLDELRADVAERRRAEAEERRDAAQRLEERRRRRQLVEARLEGVREQQRRAQREEAEAAIRLEAAVETLRRDLDCEPTVAVAVECPVLPDGASAPAHLRELERECRLLGPINPLAVEELAELQERHTFLAAQLDDVRASRRELAKVIRAVEASMLDILAAAYTDVAAHFDKLFATLFPGGHGRLRLTDPDSLLETGIEIEARPAGKNVRRLSLLSGGERSLCAMAFLFAVFRSRPSPFYLLDEVEAALDDVNLHRFLDLLAEFRDEAQLLVVTHQKRTMEAADCLHGVTMAPGGSSRVVSERLRGAEVKTPDPVAALTS